MRCWARTVSGSAGPKELAQHMRSRPERLHENRHPRQSGFSLLEVMIASVASMAVIAPAIAVMFHAFDWYAEIRSQIALNREARQAFDLIGNGAKASTNGTDATPYLYGVRGRNAAPGGTLRTNYTLQYQ